MTKLDFISGMKRLSSYYFKELTNDHLAIWYEMFKGVSIDDFNQAIKEISRESQYMPNANILLEKCGNIFILSFSGFTILLKSFEKPPIFCIAAIGLFIAIC